MAEVIQMTQLSPTMEEGLLVEWLVEEGDSVSVGDLIVEIETDKAAMEMESYFDGTILKILIQAGDSVPIGGALAIVGEPDENIDDLLEQLKTDAASAPEDSVSEAEEAQTADATEETTDKTPEDTATKTADAPRTRPGLHPVKGGRILASPLARKMAENERLPIEQIEGSGPGGRVIKRDIEDAVEHGLPAISGVAAPAAPQSKSVPLTPMRRAVARNTTDAWEIPAFMLTRKIRMDNALEFRAQINNALAAQDDAPRVSINDLIIKAVGLSLREFPDVNVAFQGDSIKYYGVSRIGIAVALDGGLITPVIQNAEGKGLREIATEVRELAGRAHDKRLQAHEYSDASFTISNLGMFGIDHFTAVLNPPGAAILAVGASAPELVAADNDRGFEQQSVMQVTLTCDHRAIDGAMGAQWLQVFARYLESPATMVL